MPAGTAQKAWPDMLRFSTWLHFGTLILRATSGSVTLGMPMHPGAPSLAPLLRSLPSPRPRAQAAIARLEGPRTLCGVLPIYLTSSSRPLLQH